MTPEEIVVRALVDHAPGEDWHCVCGEDFFGGSAAYSTSEHRHHTARNILAALAANNTANPDSHEWLGMDR